MTCPDCEYHKSRAAIWRHEAYKIGGTPLPWDVDEALQKAVLAEREACAQLCDDIWQEDGTAMQCRDAIRSRT